MYKLLRTILFRFDPERSHRITTQVLAQACRFPTLLHWLTKRTHGRNPQLPCQVMGLKFPHPIGLAAGFDKNASFIEAAFALGLGHIETGTITPRPQPGNPPPRLFRLLTHQAIINRMGFNSAGLEDCMQGLQQHWSPYPVGANLGKNRETPIGEALQDYLTGLNKVAALADYVTINISSPNTSQLRELQQSKALQSLLRPLLKRRDQLCLELGRPLPLLVKIAPDLNPEALQAIAANLQNLAVDGVIATNTTVDHETVKDHPLSMEAGGLSGQPLFPQSLHVVHTLYQVFQGRIPIIGVGGIDSPQRAWKMLLAGADLLQIYSALIYQGPGLIRRMLQFLEQKRIEHGGTTLVEAVAKARSRTQSN